VKFLVDAQLPRSLAAWLDANGHQAEHTRSLELGNRTPDKSISATADNGKAVVITKDADFLNSHLLHGTPAKLLIVRTGNISNRHLLEIFAVNIDAVINALDQSNLVELNQSGLVLHDS